jgi:hypothetical protein
MMLYGNAPCYAKKAEREGNEVTLQVPLTLSDFLQGFDKLPGTDAALNKVASLINEQNQT